MLYTPLNLESKHKVKFLFDTFGFRFGDLLGVLLQAQMRTWQLGAGSIIATTCALALILGVLGFWLGKRCPRQERVEQGS